MKQSPPFGPLGEVVYARTYAREISTPQGPRLERWPETVERVVDYSAKLSPISDNERAALYDALYDLRALPAGRTLWAGGTDHVRNHPMANFNCAFMNITNVKDFHDMVILLMNGCFTAETPILMADGKEKPISEIEPGDKVKSFNEVNGEFEEKEVLNVHQTPFKQMVTLKMDNGRMITCTEDHLFLTTDGRWVEARNLEGEELVEFDARS